jgi:hypothetical protein
VKHYLLCLFLFVSSICLSQGNILLEDQFFQFSHSYDQEINTRLLSDSSYAKLPESERLFLYWTNLFRKNPESFAKNFIKPFLVQFPSANNRSSSSLLHDLIGIKNLPFLLPNARLNELSRTHAVDLATNQKDLSHVSSTGKDFETRMQQAGIVSCGGENLLMGRRQPLENLILLLIDHNVPGFGHRKAILNPIYNIMGCSYSLVANSRQFILVQLFSCN